MPRKNQHSKDRLFVTQSEWRDQFGGKKAQKATSYKRLPFYCCALSMSPFRNPVCTPDGTVFDILNIVPYIKEHKKNPVTGEKLSLKDLIHLNFSKNKNGKYHCPITYKEFTDNSNIVAVKPSGNVYSKEAVQELNLKPRSYKDLLDGTPFNGKKEIITLQDPHDFSRRDVGNFFHVREGTARESTETKAAVRLNPTARRILSSVEKKQEAEEASKKRPYPGSELGAAKDGPQDEHVTGAGVQAGRKRRGAFTKGNVALSFTSTTLAPDTKNERSMETQEEYEVRRYNLAKKLKKKGYVQIVTTHGNLNIEVHADIVPRTSENFLGLCKRKYYDGIIFHRNIPKFMIQGGDPTGTGTGGTSVWKKSFQDEFSGKLKHSERGVLSMANSGPNSNGSQFFILYAPATYLDQKHSVFGKVVGGMDTLRAMERVPTDDDDRPEEEIKIISCTVFADPFEEVNELLEKEAAEEKAAEEAKRGHKPTSTAQIVGTKPKELTGQSPRVGKYLDISKVHKSWEKKSASGGSGKAKPRSTFGDFSGW